jgi:hypothetical protein
MTYVECIIELDKHHLYPKPIRNGEGGEVLGLKLKTSPHYKDDRLLLMKGLLPKEFSLKWDKEQEAIIITKE